MKTRLTAAVLAVMLSFSLLVGCSDNGNTQTTVTGETTAAATTTEQLLTTTTAETTTAETTTTKRSTAKKTATTTENVTAIVTVPSSITTASTTAPIEEGEPVVNVTDPTTTLSISTSTSRRTVPPRVTTTKKDWSYLFPVKVEGTIEERAAAVNNRLNGKQPVKIASERALVTEFNKDWAFTHHPGLAYFKGKWYASFTQGIKDEDAPGQRIVLSSSEDFLNWSEPVVIGPCLDNEMVNGQLTSNISSPLFVCGDRMLITYGCTSYPPEKFDYRGRFQANGDLSGITKKSFLIFTEDGVNWSEPVKFGYASNDTLRQTVTGRWFSSYGTSGRYSDEATPSGFYWLSCGLSGAQRSDATKRNNGANHTESSWFQTKDHVLHIMVRSDTDFLWMMESYDNGKTWSDLYPTNFGSSSTMWKFGELPDGRIYGVGTSGDRYTSRNKLELWISEDGVNFDTCYIIRDEEEPQQQKYGWAKGGRYGYPSVVVRDGYLHVLYSRHKEYMEVSRVKLSDIR